MEVAFEKYSHANPYIGSDKYSTHSYHIVYDQIFGEYSDLPIRLLEIGVMSGGSLLGWSTYFTHPDAVITGIDITLKHINEILRITHDPSFRRAMENRIRHNVSKIHSDNETVKDWIRLLNGQLPPVNSPI